MSEQTLTVVTMDKLNARRRELIAALRSGEYKQGSGQLLHMELGYQSSIDRHWCCIGVGCRVSEFPLAIEFESIGVQEIQSYDFESNDFEWDDDLGYRHFCDYYGFDYSKYLYLAGMNDNSTVYKLHEPLKGSDLVYVLHSGSAYNDDPRNQIRNAIPRDFNFIARFLEVVWFGGKSE